MKPSGGTELLYNNLIKYVGQDWLKDINLVISSCYYELLHENKPNVLWQHLSYDQFNVRLMNDCEFINKIQHFVYVSEWQLNEYQKKFSISKCSNHVIHNAITPIEFKEKPKNKIKIIYTSMPNRGLEVLLDAFEIMNRNDVELNIYSSNIIYGKNYSDDSSLALFNRAKLMKNVNYKGYAMNNAIRKSLQEHHIFAYPSIFQETSCLSAIEAGAAGCKIVTTNYGALPETCSQWPTYVNHTEDKKELAGNYAEVLNNSIDNYWKECYDYEKQSLWFNNKYSWKNRAEEWKQFLSKICVK